MIAKMELDLAPAPDESIVMSLTKTLALCGTRMSENTMREFQLAAVDQLRKLPGGMVLEALDQARERVTDERMIVPSVFAYCGDLKSQRYRLENTRKLLEVSKRKALT